MNMSNEEYSKYIQQKMPKSPMGSNLLKAFVIGGLICCVGQGLLDAFGCWGLSEEDSAIAECISMVFLGALLTGLGIYDKIAKHGGAGTLVPITGFSNAVTSPALEFRTEGLVTGTASKIFTIAGPVIVYGVGSSVIYGLILCVINCLS